MLKGKIGMKLGKRVLPTANRKTVALGLGFLLLFTGCLKTPESEYVTNKEGQATLISDNSISDQGIPLSEQVHAPQRAAAESDRTNEYSSIIIDAQVVVPDSTAIPVYQVSTMEIDADYVENTATAFFKEGMLYNGYPGYSERTQEDIYEDINYYSYLLEHCEVVELEDKVMEHDDETGEPLQITPEYAADIRNALNSWRAELETAPERGPIYGDPVSYELIPTEDGLVYMEEGAAYTDDFKRLPYHNNLAYFTGFHDNREYYLIFEQDNYNTGIHISFSNGEEIQGFSTGTMFVHEQYRNNVTEQNECKYSIEEAEDLCKELLTVLNLPDMELDYVTDAELFWETTSLGRKGYILYFYQSYNGITDVYLDGVDNQMIILSSYGSNIMVNQQKAQDAAYDWNGNPDQVFTVDAFHEKAVFLVTDDGIVYAEILNPKVTGECLAENVTLLDFDQVLQQGLHQMENQYANAGTQMFHNNIRINTIELNYACMQSPNQRDEYIMIPVWDFKTGINGKTVISINAIDGSLFVREKGY